MPPIVVPFAPLSLCQPILGPYAFPRATAHTQVGSLLLEDAYIDAGRRLEVSLWVSRMTAPRAVVEAFIRDFGDVCLVRTNRFTLNGPYEQPWQLVLPVLTEIGSVVAAGELMILNNVTIMSYALTGRWPGDAYLADELERRLCRVQL